jgi:hypothetical protein
MKERREKVTECVKKVFRGRKEEEGAQARAGGDGEGERKGSEGGVSQADTVVEDKDGGKKESAPGDNEGGSA